MNRLPIALFATITSASVFGAVDATCLSDCQTRGYQYQLCLERCSFNSTSSGSGGGGYWHGYRQGQQAAEEIRQQQLRNKELEMRNRMISNADAACKNGNKQACADLRAMLFTK